MIGILVLSLPLNVDVVLATNITSNTSVTISQLTSASSNVNTHYQSNKKLPTYVTVSGRQITMPQFLYLLAKGTLQLNSGSTAAIPMKNVNMPTKSAETLTKGNIPKTEYVSLSKTLKKYVDTYGKIPNYLSTSHGKMKMESAVIMLSKVMIFYKTNHRLPNYVGVSPWTGKNYTLDNGSISLVEITVTQNQLNDAASGLKSFIENYNQIPVSVSVGGQKVSISQFLQLLANSLKNIYYNQNNALTAQKIYIATNPSEDITAGVVQKTEYMRLACSLANLNTDGRIPNSLNTTLGNMRYESAVHMFLKALYFYNTNNRLPSYVSVVPWTGTTVYGTGSGLMRPVYIISDMISNTATDNARINAVVSGLEKLGLDAFNYGVGTDNIGILKNTNIPINALIVEFCGGACAGTIYEMGTSYYKNLKGTRKVFMVFTDGATRITGLDWLIRAHDDNFSPASFTGLAHPDQYLLNNGYQYYEGYNSNKLSTLVQILYNEATS